MITVLQVVFCSLLLSAFFFTGITTLFLTGVFNLSEIVAIFPQQVQVLILTAVLLILFSVIFVYINIRQYFVEKEEDDISCQPSYSPEFFNLIVDEIEVIEPEDISYSSEFSDLVVNEAEIVEPEDISCSPEFNDLMIDETEVVEPEDISCSPESSDLVTDEIEIIEPEDISCLPESSDLMIDEAEIVELEDISTGSGGNVSIMRRLFAFSPGNPELLQVVEHSTTGISGKVIYEHNGIHYINRDAFTGGGNTEQEINDAFAQLVESVINRV